MEFIMDMVHDNPGEERTKSIFRNPKTLVEYGYNTQVFKHIQTIATFSALGEDFFPKHDGKQWLAEMTKIVDDEVFSAKAEGLMVMNHIDLFVLPKLLVEKYKDEMCDENGKISIYKEKTKEIHRVMFDELFERYPIDGLIIRVGETYLHDAPYHVGNGAVEYGDIEAEKDAFVELINFLREEVCIKHNKYLFFRTWDCFPDRFHADLQYYLDVTNRIEPCGKLVFSIKHTALDFWRRVKFNPCIGEGKHRQIIEVQCQREYEGKGAYPSYVMDGVINGFSEIKDKKGLRDFCSNPLICGIYGWSRGGGWFGPYIKNEFWCELNSYVISHYAQNPNREEKDIFFEFAKIKMGLDENGAEIFYQLCKKASDAVLHGRYIEAYDKTLNEEIMPCNNWTRDDKLGGLRQLNDIFDYLDREGLTDEAIAEKEKSVKEWQEVKEMFAQIEMKDKELEAFIENSIEYGFKLYEIAYISFKMFAAYRAGKSCREILEEYDRAWAEYRELEKRPQASSLYDDTYYFSENNLGLNETVELCRKAEAK